MTTVRVGVGCFLFNSKFEFITGVRKGSHGSGAIQLPGGHLEKNESPEECAIREVAEETSIEIELQEIRFMTATNDIFEREGKHYVTLFVGCRVPDDVEPKVLEPEKCESWQWTTWDKLIELASDEMDESLFLPLRNLIRQRPDLDPRQSFSQESSGAKRS